MFDRQRIASSFGAASSGYHSAAALQRASEDALLDRLDFLKNAPQTIVDLGAGPGRAAGVLCRRYPKAHLIALDLALPMLQLARREFSWRRRFSRVCADAHALPLPSQSVDLLFSSLCLQWCTDLRQVYGEIRRVLKPGGLFLFATLGPETLDELRAAWTHVDAAPHVHGFPDLQVVGNALMASGLRDPMLERDVWTRHHASVRELMRELQTLGAANADTRRTRGLYGPKALAKVENAYEPLRTAAGIPSTWEMYFGIAFGPPTGQPIRERGMDIATFPLDQLKVAKR
jgi:malonyl-CoA O-methyltransferase